jgi:predicted dehydrogenase
VVVGVVGSGPGSSRAAAEALGTERTTETLDDLLAADDVDVVHVCTPNATHAGLVRAVLAAGKHVVCEKPLAVNPAQAEELVQLADDAGVTATVPFVYRFYPTVREARARVADGTTGDVRLLHGSYLQDWLAEPGDDNWRVDSGAGGPSRAFADIGVHWCDLMEFTTGHRITRLTARTATAFPERATGGAAVAVRTEDGAGMLFETDRGAFGSLVVSQVSPGRKNRLWFSFDAEAASYVFDQERPDTLWVGGRSENRVIPRGPDTLSPGAREYALLPAGHPQGYQDCFNAFVGDAYAAIAGGRPDGLPTFADGVRAAALTAAVIDSAARQTWEEVPA